jgi:hypothetical protein
VKVLENMKGRVELHKKDNTNKFWCYKVRTGKRLEFAFNPKTSTGLFVRADTLPPAIAGITNVTEISGESTSTSLKRVFSGGNHRANYKANIETEFALRSLVEHYEKA